MLKYMQSMCDAYNSMEGSLPGTSCPVCRNKGLIAFMDGTEEKRRECACMAARRSTLRIEKSGLAHLMKACTFENYDTSEPWQADIAAGAKQFLNDHTGKWFYIGGQVGSGKTHICTAIASYFLQHGMNVRYMLWRDEVVRIKSAVNDDDEYFRLVDPLKTADVLYIDDFFKTSAGDDGRRVRPTQGDINVAFEIINSRYNHPDRITILSGEWFSDELLGIDEAVGSRVYQRSKEYCFGVRRDDNRNYRMKGWRGA